MLILQGVAYRQPNKDLLFENINASINTGDKIALIGNNGTGKSTLLRLLAGDLAPSAGTITSNANPYYVPQHFGQYDSCTVAKALGVDKKLNALHKILAGDTSAAQFDLLADDWTIEERCNEAMEYWGLQDINLQRAMVTLSGGQKTKVFLAGIDIHQPGIVLLDEPSNHLDAKSRIILYEYIQKAKHSLVVVSHDRTLLNMLDTVYKLDKKGIHIYGGNYDFYAEQKRIESEALQHDLKSKEKVFRKAKETERETMERQQKLDARGKKKKEKAGVPTIAMNTLRNNAEKSTARIKAVHTGKLDSLSREIGELRNQLPGIDKMRISFDDSTLHTGKILVSGTVLNYHLHDRPLWKQGLTIEIASGDRIAIKGDNGSGKTTLLKLILGQVEPTEGTIRRNSLQTVYIDQDYSIVNSKLSLYEQAQQFNSGALPGHEIKNQLNRFLFTKEFWDKPCNTLSGGERMRLCLCCLSIYSKAPDMIILDEPTNNLDMQNIEILTMAISEYKGTLVVVSHDAYFLGQVNTTSVIDLNS
jgi:ATPase subunit of ABC transporter with duplicated ATPase domains